MNKIFNAFLTVPNLRSYNYKTNLGITKREFNAFIDKNFKFIPVNTRQEAWEAYKVYPNELSFCRATKLGSTFQFRKNLISLVMTDDNFKEQYVTKGLSTEELAEVINMPFITGVIVASKAKVMKLKHSAEDKERIRIRSVQKTYSDENKLKAIIQKQKDTFTSRYGVDNPMKSEIVKDKFYRTMIEKYGTEHALNNNEILNNLKKSNLDKYGVETTLKDEGTIEKINKTNILRYGSIRPQKSDIVKNKTKATNIERYGFPYLTQVPEFKEKAVNTNLERYGFPNAMQAREVKEKIKQTNLERYGRPYARNNNILFTPTPYVSTKQHAIAITETPETLENFLNQTFPEQEQFTLHEVALITGRPYNLIKAKFNINLSFINPSQQGHLPEQMQNFLEELGYEPGRDFIVNDRQAIKPLEIDFYFAKQKVGIEVNDFATHNTTVNPFGGPVKSKKYHMEKSKLAKEKGIRLIHAWEQYFSNPNQLDVLKNAIKHALGISPRRIYARNTYVKEVPNISLKQFFNENNIQGFRGANKAYALFDKKTDEVLMAYSVGSSHFAHNKYDMELIRGASKLDTTIVGGASKLWKFIIKDNPQANSIVYYIDRNIYNGSSISSLEGHLTLLSTQEGFWNYFVEEDTIKNRQPAKHKEIKELVKQGKVWEIYNAGTETYVWNR